ncbi:chaplin family protein [Nocardiopsis mangrovi]|uniref:Chaplin family protein n=1 Tax=Nocardiopsis mangrovi TaxID=1179818 RepID=A0ABV9DY60_9ACTN
MSRTYTTTFAALVAAGFFTVAPIASADTSTSGNGSLGGGNQAVADADVPVNLCGNAVALLGNSGAQCSGSGAAVVEGKGRNEGSSTSTSGNGSLLGGNQLDADADVPVNACGNAVSVLGNSGADCDDSGAAVGEGTGSGRGDGHGDGHGDGDGPDGYPGGDDDEPGREPDGGPGDDGPGTDGPEGPGGGEPEHHGNEEEGEGTPDDHGATSPDTPSGGDTAPAGPGSEAEVSSAGDAALPATGTGLIPFVAAAVGAVAVGAGALLLGRRRGARSRR